MKRGTFLIIDTSENNADLFYRTRFFVPDPVIYIEHNGEKTLVLSDLEIDRGKNEAAVDKILSLSEYQKNYWPESGKGSDLRILQILY